ncbi:MAG TPA: 2-oxoacid:ferredoxin oxidoreductase subunit beta [Symbiobacteriaceae bacterium]|nr:2-oxoacid:ferredoxin oxidoreductase subunit beta [Symbiobacteriaceae bacterium]
MATAQEFRGAKPTWCPGCGDFAVLQALQTALANTGNSPHETVVASGIGCSGKTSQYVKAYGFHGLHGRTIPAATAIKLVNHSLTVIATGGDGDGYGIGLSHSLHAMRRNVDITYIVMDNNIYGLTTGQMSPTSRKGFKSKTSPTGSAEDPIRPLELALGAGASFIAQGFSGEPKHLTRLFEAGIRHKGFSLINVFSPCVTFNKVNTYEWFKEHLVNLDTVEGYDPTDKYRAARVVGEHDGLVLGVVYREERPVYHDALPAVSDIPIAYTSIDLPVAERYQILDSFR